MGIFSSIAGAIAGPLIGGIFGGGSKSTTTKSRTNFRQMRDDAIRAGFNPLSALKYTGGAGNTSTTSTVPSLSTKEFLADALSAGAQTWFNRDKIARDEQVEQLEINRLQGELDRIQKMGRIPTGTFGYSIPQVVGNGVGSSGTVSQRVQPSLAPRKAPARKPVTGEIFETPEVVPMEQVPLTMKYRTGAKGGEDYVGLNPDAFEVGIDELLVGGIVHGTSYAMNEGAKVIRKVKKPLLHWWEKPVVPTGGRNRRNLR